MSDQTRYLLFLIEQYALNKGTSGDEAFSTFEQYDLIEYINSMYYTYHSERVENAIADIDRRIAQERGQDNTNK